MSITCRSSSSILLLAFLWNVVLLGLGSTDAWTTMSVVSPRPQPPRTTTACRSSSTKHCSSLEESQNDRNSNNNNNNNNNISHDSQFLKPNRGDVSGKTITNTMSNRRTMLESMAITTATSLLMGSSFLTALDANAVETSSINEGTQEVFQLPSGLKYIEIKEGTGPTPMYGQLVSIAYKGYIKLPKSKEDANPKPQVFGQSNAYLLKHGNGRTIPGLDQGLHTMRVGGTRRLIIPAKLGYVRSGLGPLPPSPWDRYRLNNLLDDMVRLQGGNLVFEVTLLSAINDEADQGYYNDASLTPEEFETLRSNLQQKSKATKNTAPL